MRRSLLGGAAIAALVVVVAGGITAGASSRGAGTGQTLTVIQSAPDVVSVDLGEAGPGPGDLLVFRSTLLDETGAAEVGDLHIQCTVNFGSRVVCLGIFTLTGRGQISVDALPEFPLPAVGMVTGGTGAFQRSRGEAHIEPQADGTTVITFHLFG
ncbi:MAG: hypothetical protein HYU54_08530 [Actinobacteria bacterium]|nr:hypothetical protein [Actinomycetota bacterium]